MDDLNLSHIRVAKHLLIDVAWYKPGNFCQILIIEYKDIILNEKIPGAYIITNNKKYKLYNEILKSFKNIINQNGEYKIQFISITTDDEKALVKAVKNIFPNVIHINCFFHYKKDLNDYFNGDIGYVDTVLNNLKKKYNEFANLLDNYFIKYKYNYFINGDYNYSKIPKDVRSNSFLENYNTFLKKKLGKKNLSWIKFISFIKKESIRIRE